MHKVETRKKNKLKMRGKLSERHEKAISDKRNASRKKLPGQVLRTGRLEGAKHLAKPRTSLWGTPKKKGLRWGPTVQARERGAGQGGRT